MSDPLPPALAEAEARSRNARDRLLGTLGQIQDRLNPMTLAQGAVESVAINVVRDTVETVRSRPRAMAMAAGAALLFMARKPIARLLWRGTRHATAAVPASLKARRARRATKGSSK